MKKMFYVQPFINTASLLRIDIYDIDTPNFLTKLTKDIAILHKARVLEGARFKWPPGPEPPIKISGVIDFIIL